MKSIKKRRGRVEERKREMRDCISFECEGDKFGWEIGKYRNRYEESDK